MFLDTEKQTHMHSGYWEEEIPVINFLTFCLYSSLSDVLVSLNILQSGILRQFKPENQIPQLEFLTWGPRSFRIGL
jgi:hypothetical protein